MDQPRRWMTAGLAAHNPHRNSRECSSINTILRINGVIGHSSITFLLDSGAALSVIRLNILPTEFQDKITKATAAPVGASGTPLDVIGQVQMLVRIGSHQSEQVFTVVKMLTVDCLLGVDYLTANEVIIDYKHNHVTIRGHIIPFTLKNGIANTIQFSSNNAVTSTLKTTTIPGRTIQLLDVQLPNGVTQQNFSSVLIEPLHTSRLPKHRIAARTISPTSSSKCAVIQVMNIIPAAVTVYKGTKVGNITPLSDLLIVDNEYIDHPPSPMPDLPNIDLTKSGLSSDQQQSCSHCYTNIVICLPLMNSPWDVHP